MFSSIRRTERIEMNTSNITRIPIGDIPITILLKISILYDFNKNETIQAGKCPYDQGAYFIVDGKENSIFLQERVATNKLVQGWVEVVC